MEDVDTQEIGEHDDEHLFMRDVVQDEHELLFLDSYLRESFRRHGMGGTVASGGGTSGAFEDESTI